MSSEPNEITELLNRVVRGEDGAARELFPAVYEELRRLASARARSLPPGATLQTTALVHEAYLRIVDRHPDGWEGKRWFYFVASRAMRDIVVEEARRRSAQKRGGGRQRLSLEDVSIAIESAPDDVLALDAALTQLETDDPEGHQLVTLRYFTGLSMPEAAEVMGVPLRTLERRWRFLRAWLAREIESQS